MLYFLNLEQYIQIWGDKMDKIAKTMRELGQAQAQVRREKARASVMKRKEEYLGARVPGELRAKVIARANDLGIPVSILIRNILEEAFPIARTDDKASTQNGPQSEQSGVDGSEETQFPNVIGWEQITLNRPMICTACARQIESSARVTLGLTSPGDEHVILCSSCKLIG